MPRIGHKTALVVSDDGINMGMNEPVVARITDKDRHREMSTSVWIPVGTIQELRNDSWVLCHDLTTLLEEDFITHLGVLPFDLMEEVERKLKIALRLD